MSLQEANFIGKIALIILFTLYNVVSPHCHISHDCHTDLK